jgi:hypothetical protein
MPEYLGEFLCVGDQRVDLENKVKVVPSLEDYLRVVFLLCYGKVADLQQEVE